MKSVSELIRRSGDPKPELYLIPDYQRGYRWQAKEQVFALLEDLKDFIEKSKQYSDIYCLQPVVVTSRRDEERQVWEVIDGQQRLTTLYLLLHALQSDECYSIRFEAREESNSFLEDLVQQGTKSDKTPDYYFMSEAYSFIQQWLAKKQIELPGFKDKFRNRLKEQVKVIWYEVEASSEREKIEIFNRLNIGKIPLDDAELIRALFLNHICPKGDLKEEAQSAAQETHEEILRKGIFATEWLEIEYYLRQSSVWGFLFPSKDAQTKAPSNRILKLFELIAKEQSDHGRATFRYFEQRLQSKSNDGERSREVERFWEETKSLFAFLRACYTDRKLYHRMGLLLSLGTDLAELIEKRWEDKDSYLCRLDKKLKEYFGRIKWETLGYDSNRKQVEQVLLLFNVLTLDQMADTQEHRFPFDRYNAEQWSIEHIHPQNIEGLEKISDPSEWIRLALDSLEGVEELKSTKRLPPFSELKRELRELLDPKAEKRNERFLETARALSAYLSDDSSVHELENLALLSTRSNAALNNSFFPTKRKRLLEQELQGNFIPPCTRNVFLKAYSPLNSFPYLWGEQDKRCYLEKMKELLADYILFTEPEQEA